MRAFLPPGRTSLLAIALLAGLACGAEESLGGGPPPVTVEAVALEPEPFTDVVELVGQLESEESIVVRPEISGVIASIEFEEGQAVAAGDVLFRLRDAAQRAALREAVARRALAKDVYARTAKLAKQQVSALADLDRAIAELEASEAGVDLAQVELDRTRIRAPFDAVVGARRVSPGDRVDPSTELVPIDKVDRLQLVFTMPDSAVGIARVGLPVQASFAPYADERFAGEVYFVSPTLDPDTRRLLLKAWLPNDERRLRPGLFATLEVVVERIPDALLAPESAIVYDGRGAFVWRVLEDDTAERVDVQLGARRHGRVVVRAGLSGGDVIVSAGTHKVAAGEPLILQRREAPEPGALAADGRSTS